jgi:hypothetical protein
MQNAAEKRKHNRFDFQKTVKVFPVLPSKSGNIFEVQKDPFELRASDISEGGLKLETPKSLAGQFLFKLNFEVASEQNVEVYGKVMWSGDKHCGVRFMLTDPLLRKGIRSMAKKNNPSSN